jgi:hypothetical protein
LHETRLGREVIASGELFGAVGAWRDGTKTAADFPSV